MQPMPPPPGTPPPSGTPPPGTPPPPYGYGYGAPFPPPRKSQTWLWILLGVGGGVVVVGILAAVAIPSFLGYMKKAKRMEGERDLRALELGARQYFAERDSFPTGAVPLTPTEPCCAFSGRKCPVDGALWGDPVWSDLGFAVSRPTDFQYSYLGSSDGKSFTVVARADLDCDTIAIEYTLTGTIVDGSPTFTVVPPAGGD